MEQINYEPYLKDWKPPEDLVDWAYNNGGFPKEYLVYRAGWEYNPLEDRNHRAVEVTCSKCGATFTAAKVDAGGCSRCYPSATFGWFNTYVTEPVISGSDTICPCCGQAAQTVHIGNMRYGIEDYCYVTQVVRVPVPGVTDRLALLEWQVVRHINKEGRTSYGKHLWTAWVVEERKLVRLKGWNRFLSAISYTPLTQKKTFLDDYGKYEKMYPFEESVLYGTTGENCKLDRYIKQDGLSLVAYLSIWRKKPALENLIMQGCGMLVEELIHEEQHHGTYERNKGIPKLKCIDWKEKKPHRMLHLSKEEFRKYGTELTAADLHLIGSVRGKGIPLDFDTQLKTLKKYSRYTVERILEEQPAELFWKIMKYSTLAGNDYITLRDYWRMAQTLDMDLDEDLVRWPKDLKKAHDRVTKEYAKRKTQIQAECFTKRLAELSPLSWHCDGILIRPCASQQEMKDEGKMLHHCVARYAEDHAMGKTAIFLIRLECEPDKPFFTLEWDEKKQRVVQNRGNHNCARTPEVEAFEGKWLQWIKENAVKPASEKRRKCA